MTSASEVDDDTLSAILSEIASENDRVAAISSAAFIEFSLQQFLEAAWPPISNTTRNRLFEGRNAPLASFSAKIEMGLAIGLYGPVVRSDLDKVRLIRNRFAHSMRPLDFDDAKISAHVGNFQIGQSATLAANAKHSANRRRFTMVTRWLLINLLIARQSLPKSGRNPTLP